LSLSLIVVVVIMEWSLHTITPLGNLRGFYLCHRIEEYDCCRE